MDRSQTLSISRMADKYQNVALQFPASQNDILKCTHLYMIYRLHNVLGHSY